jgi:hypothetical protein
MLGTAGDACTTNSPAAHREDHLAIGIRHEGKRVVAQGGEIPRSAQGTPFRNRAAPDRRRLRAGSR